MKELIEEVQYKFGSGSNHTFLFHLNINDIFIDKEGKFRTLTENLLANSPLSDSCFVAFFNLATGIRFKSVEEEAKFVEFLLAFDPGEVKMFSEKRGSLSYALGLFSRLLPLSLSDKNVSEALKKASEKNKDMKKFSPNSKRPFFSVVIEYLETIIHPNSSCSGCAIDREALVAHMMWAKDMDIRRANNLIILLADNIASVAPQILSETTEISICKVGFPVQSERERTYLNAKSTSGPTSGDLEPSVFAKSSGGMSTKGIIGLVRECHLRREPVSPKLLFERKKKFIEEKSGGLLKIKRPLCGMRAIGGLDKYKEHIYRVVGNMTSGNWAAVSNGTLLLGAPGTCKTAYAEALAFEANVPFVVMKTVRDMWVGSSERNLELILDLILAQAPVVVFIDEIDQQFQMRGGIGDNTGTNQRMSSRFFEFMGDTTNRGKVLWLAASNRPDLMDDALLREGRFDDRIPFFPPSASERALIVPALLHKMEVLAESENTPFKWELSPGDIYYFARRAHCHIKGNNQEKEAVKCNEEDDHPEGMTHSEDGETYFTGGQIENILRRAWEKASSEGGVLDRDSLLWALEEDFIPSDSMLRYDLMTELAVRFSNSARFLPLRGRWAKLAQSRGVALSRRSDSITTPKFST